MARAKLTWQIENSNATRGQVDNKISELGEDGGGVGSSVNRRGCLDKQAAPIQWSLCLHVGKQAQCGSSLREALSFASSECWQPITKKKKKQIALLSQTKYSSRPDPSSSVPLFKSKINSWSKISCSSETRFPKPHKLLDGCLAWTTVGDGYLR